MAKGLAVSTGNLPQGGLPRNSVDKITDRPDMTSAVDRGRKALTKKKKKKILVLKPRFTGVFVRTATMRP